MDNLSVSDDILMLPMLEPGDSGEALMSNHCQACASGQGSGRQSVSLEYLHKDFDEGYRLEGDTIDLLVTSATKSKPSWQERVAKMSGCNGLESLCAGYPTGLALKDGGGGPAGATPSRWGPSCDPARG
jgi:hypothetical protein